MAADSRPDRCQRDIREAQEASWTIRYAYRIDIRSLRPALQRASPAQSHHSVGARIIVATVAPGRARYLVSVEIGILGPIEAHADGDVLPLGGLRERALLALFVLSPGQTISTDRLIDELWGEDLPANPSNALQALISRLRRAVGSDTVVTRAPGCFLDIQPEAVDAARFRALVDTARSEHDPAVRSRLFTEALSLWRGLALAEFPIRRVCAAGERRS